MSEFDILSAAGPLAPFLVDPNSTLGLRWEGATARQRGRGADDNPFTRSHPGSLAELYWWEGWWLEGQRAGGAKRPDLPAAATFAKACRAAAREAAGRHLSPPSSEREGSRDEPPPSCGSVGGEP